MSTKIRHNLYCNCQISEIGNFFPNNVRYQTLIYRLEPSKPGWNFSQTLQRNWCCKFSKLHVKESLLCWRKAEDGCFKVPTCSYLLIEFLWGPEMFWIFVRLIEFLAKISTSTEIFHALWSLLCVIFLSVNFFIELKKKHLQRA